MVAKDQSRANGKTAGEEIVKELSEEFEQPASVELPDERERKFKSPGFSRMRTEWRGEDAAMMGAVHAAIDRLIENSFEDAFAIMHEVYDTVREPVLDPQTGEPQRDAYGLTVWKQTPTGLYEEDWSRLTYKQRERFLYLITTRLFEWTQRAAASWAEAMFAKAKWEDAFSLGYESLDNPKATIGDREARAKVASRDDRYFAIYMSYYSKKADSIVRSLELLSQRLKDVHVSNGSR